MSIDPVRGFIFQIIGAFIVWAFKGFKGSLNDEMTRPNQSNNKSFRNIIISVLFLFLVAIILDKINESKKEQTEINANEYRIHIK